MCWYTASGTSGGGWQSQRFARSLPPTLAGILYPDMYARDLTGTHVEMRSLRELVGTKAPRLGARLDALGCDMSLLATDWFLCLFATTLPPEVRRGQPPPLGTAAGTPMRLAGAIFPN